MASRPEGYGFTAEIKSKLDSKYDAEIGRSRFEFRMISLNFEYMNLCQQPTPKVTQVSFAANAAVNALRKAFEFYTIYF